MKRLLPLLAILLASCGDLQSGGFETTDLQARVVRPDGTPVAAARVWLVRSSGDSAPAIVLDSGFSDGSGSIRFAVPAEGSGGLGLDSRLGDSLGLAPSVFAQATAAQVVVRKSLALRVSADSLGPANCFVPGSHFASRLDADGRTARFDLPSGTWSLAIRRGRTVSLSVLHLERDSVLAPDTARRLDTSAPAALKVLAARTQALSQEGLDLDVVNNEAIAFDSLALRLFLDGTAADMADFAIRLDLAQLYTADGFQKAAGLDASGWTRIVPVPVDASCPAGTACTWSFDLPLSGAILESGGRLRVSVVFDRHVGSGDSLRYASGRPTHDPFSGSDWSFRARTWADSTHPVAGMPDYGGVPISVSTALPETAPYIVLRRNARWLSGKAPSLKL